VVSSSSLGLAISEDACTWPVSGVRSQSDSVDSPRLAVPQRPADPCRGRRQVRSPAPSHRPRWRRGSAPAARRAPARAARSTSRGRPGAAPRGCDRASSTNPDGLSASGTAAVLHMIPVVNYPALGPAVCTALLERHNVRRDV
jgi:hypothetical protein